MLLVRFMLHARTRLANMALALAFPWQTQAPAICEVPQSRPDPIPDKEPAVKIT